MTYLFRLKNNRILLLFLGVFLCFVGHSKNTEPPRASFLEFNTAFGQVFNTNDFVSNIPGYQAFSLRFARASNGSRWEDFAYNMPFFGVGFYMPFFVNNPGLGNPFSIYIFRGNTLHQFTNDLGLVFEMSLGLSMNWDPYDIFDNPENLAISTRNNVHVGAGLFLEYSLSRNFDLKFGVNLNHFSNGASRRPNRGVNMGALSLSMVYNFNPPNKGVLLRNPPLLKPPTEIPRRIDHTVQFIASSRQTRFSTYNTGLPSPYLDRDFTVLGLAYSPMITRGYRFKWGPSVRLIYDESSNATARRETHPESGLEHDRVFLAPFGDRLSFGMGLAGEITMPVISIFAKLGYSVFHRHHDDSRLYQVIGAKAYLQDNFFMTFGISATQFSVAQYLYWSFGYTISAEPRRRRNRT